MEGKPPTEFVCSNCTSDPNPPPAKIAKTDEPIVAAPQAEVSPEHDQSVVGIDQSANSLATSLDSVALAVVVNEGAVTMSGESSSK